MKIPIFTNIFLRYSHSVRLLREINGIVTPLDSCERLSKPPFLTYDLPFQNYGYPLWLLFVEGIWSILETKCWAFEEALRPNTQQLRSPTRVLVTLLQVIYNPFLCVMWIKEFSVCNVNKRKWQCSLCFQCTCFI